MTDRPVFPLPDGLLLVRRELAGDIARALEARARQLERDTGRPQYELRAAARAFAAISSAHRAVEDPPPRPVERMCRICGTRPAARHRSHCRARVCEATARADAGT